MSAAASEQRSCLTAALAPTCRPTPRSVSNTESLRLRYHPNRNFDKLFEGDGQMPIDKDAIAQFIGWMGELTQTNPLFNWRLRDSDPAA